MATSETRPLQGMRIAALVNNDTYRDSRVKKECAALVEAGADVTLVGWGSKYPGALDELPYRLVLVEPKSPPVWYRSLGRETVFYPLRVAVNLSLRPYYKKNFASVHTPIVKALRSEHFDAIHANDFDMLETGAYLARRMGARLVYDSHEIFLAPGRWELAPAVQERFEHDEQRLFQDLDGFITVNPQIGDYLVSRYGSSIEPVIVYNGSTHAVPEAQPAHTPLRVFFLGIFQPFYHFSRLIPQLTRFRGRMELTLQGYGGEEDAIREAISASQTEDFIRILPPVDTFSIIDASKNHDVGLINLEAGNLNQVMASPNKFFDYLSAGLAVVAPLQLEFVQSIIEQTGAGSCYDQQKPEDILPVLDHLIGNPTEVSAMKRNALATAPHFTWDIQKRKLVELYSSLR
ncbi:MAG: glycosyltransferase [Coriobacteriia bacterium]|nr:glycosyltransferase [Coriobacteriia bacterium]